MVQSSYKNRKKNRKQSFKRKNTDGNRKVKFIEDDDDNKMVGGNKEEVAKLMTKYKDYPLSGLVLAAFSNARCAREDQCEAMASDRSNLSSLQNSVYKCEDILKTLPDINGKPEIRPWEKNKDSEFIAYLDECIGYIIKNIFIPKDLIQHVYVQNDDGNEWTTLTNANFVEVESVGLDNRYAKDIGTKKRRRTTASDDGEIGENDETYTHQEEAKELDSSRHINPAGSGNSGKQKKALAPKVAVTVGLGQDQFDAARDKALEDEQQNLTDDMLVHQSSVSGPQQQRSNIRKGDKVEVKNIHTLNSGEWFPATVTNVNENGNFDIKYDSGETDWVRPGDVRHRPPP